MSIELHAVSAFSFLRGASLPEELVARAAELGLTAMALVDRDGVSGAPRFFKAAKAAGIRPLVGAELTLAGGGCLPVLVSSPQGYRNLCQIITRMKAGVPKGTGALRLEHRNALFHGHLLDMRVSQLLPASGRTIRLRDYAYDLVTFTEDRFQRRHREVRCTPEENAHYSGLVFCHLLSSNLRLSGLSRSKNRIPSR